MAFVDKIDDRGRSFLDRLTGDINHWPAIISKDPPCKSKLARYRGFADIIGFGGLVEREQAIAADLYKAVCAGYESDDERISQREQRIGWRRFDDKRDVGRLVSAVGQID